MSEIRGYAVVGQSGGPTAAINATLAGVIEGVITSGGGDICGLLGMRHGIDGLLSENFVDLSAEFTENGELDTKRIARLRQTPAAALGSCRHKLPDPEDEPEFYERLISIFRKHNIRYFFYIGGNDSMDTVSKLGEYVSGCGYEMRVVGIPKTIDNDLCATDHTPGFGSAAKYVAATLQEICLDCAVYTVPAVTVVEIMGRDAGWLTASAGIPKLYGSAAPDLIYLPEVSFSVEDFLSDVQEELSKKPNVVVAVSEGIRLADGKYVCELSRDASLDVFGHKALTGTSKTLELIVKDKIGCKVRSVELNISQRCAAHIASLTDIEESKSVGTAGVRAAIGGRSEIMMSIVRKDGNSYSVTYEPKDVHEIANQVRSVPRDFINERGNFVTDECIHYLAPLICGEPDIKFANGLPLEFVF
mgnify:CR=1 FL=1